MKTHFKKLRNPNYIGSWDLMDENGIVKNKVVTISDTKKEMVFDGKGSSEECVVIHFKECKPMVANATNLKMISKVLNSVYIEDWVGKAIELTTKKVKAFGEIHDAIRVTTNAPNSIRPDYTSYIDKIKNCATEADLKELYLSLPKDVMKATEVISAKDKRKTELLQ